MFVCGRYFAHENRMVTCCDMTMIMSKHQNRSYSDTIRLVAECRSPDFKNSCGPWRSVIESNICMDTNTGGADGR